MKTVRARVMRYLENGIFSFDEISEFTKVPRATVERINWDMKNADSRRTYKRNWMRAKRGRNVG